MPPPSSEPPPPLRLLLAAGPGAPGVAELLADATSRARAGGSVRILLTEAGLAHLSTDGPPRWTAAGVPVTLCARSARANKLDPMKVPSVVAWSSVTSFLLEAAAGATVWTAFP